MLEALLAADFDEGPLGEARESSGRDSNAKREVAAESHVRNHGAPSAFGRLEQLENDLRRSVEPHLLESYEPSASLAEFFLVP